MVEAALYEAAPNDFDSPLVLKDSQLIPSRGSIAFKNTQPRYPGSISQRFKKTQYLEVMRDENKPLAFVECGLHRLVTLPSSCVCFCRKTNLSGICRPSIWILHRNVDVELMEGHGRSSLSVYCMSTWKSLAYFARKWLKSLESDGGRIADEL